MLRTTCVDSAGALSTTGVPGFADRWVWYLWAAGALALLLRFLRAAALKGPYDQAVPGRLTALGWYLPVAAALVAAVAATARSTLLGAVRMHEDLEGTV